MKNFTKPIIDSYFKSLRGEENFWVVLFGWGVLLYVVSIFIGFHEFKNTTTQLSTLSNLLKIFFLLPFGMVGSMGIIFVFLYPFVFCFSLIKCSKKYGVIYLAFALILTLIFLFFHYGLCYALVLPISLAMIKSSKLGAIMMLLISIYIFIKTLKSLSDKPSSTNSLPSSTSFNQNLK